MHKFDASRAGLLDSEERRKFLPPEDILRKIGVREDRYRVWYRLLHNTCC